MSKKHLVLYQNAYKTMFFAFGITNIVFLFEKIKTKFLFNNFYLKLLKQVSIIFITGLFLFYQANIEYHKLFPDDYQLFFLDVNLGDASLLKTPQGKVVVIDTSADDQVLSQISEKLSFFEKTIDILILSHGDSDHIGGATAILNRFKVNEVWFNGAGKSSPVFAEFMDTLNHKNISYRILDQNQDYQVEKHISLDTIYPFNNLTSLKDHGNNESLVFLLSIFDHKILFTGDIEQEIEQAILLNGENLKADILKVAHHGSKTSSSSEFLDNVNPQWSIIQADTNNRFGHPHQVIMDRFKQKNLKTLRTGMVGDIQFTFTKEGIKEAF